jgi:alkylhydroperoxidase/carboxymuconolactone decarboxylase family protein
LQEAGPVKTRQGYPSKKFQFFNTKKPKGRENMETYYNPEDLPKFGEMGQEAGGLAQKFFDYYGAVMAEGELSEREKALIALAVAHAIQCPYCIDAYTQACLQKGSNLAEMTEAVHVVTAIRGGASLIHGLQMRNVAKKLSF